MSSPHEPRPRVLPWAALALTLLLVLRSLGLLLAQVQLASGAAFGDLEALATGPSLDFVADTQALLTMWQEAATVAPVKALIRWTTGAYTGVDLVFAGVYAILLVQLWRRVRGHLPAYPQGSEAEWSRLRRWAHLASLPYLAVAAAGADVVEDVLRLTMVLRATGGHAIPGWLIWLSWLATTAKFALLAVFAVFLVVLVADTRKLRAWLKRMWWATWRLRVAVAAVGLFAGALLFDVTGQAIDLVRRWVDSRADLFGGVLTVLGSALLGLAAWLMARRLVLA
ncbi:MAG: hypothetical protein HOV79_17010, partial [Hamadaea sp.]|nr:hypothetical protein [Hamadaea sp.]